MTDYHVPVLLKECVEALQIRPNGVYVDVTFGAGGHSQSILKEIGVNGHLYGFDQDDDAIQNRLKDERLTLIKANFRYLKKYLRVFGVTKVSGILADLGVSSHQLDMPERGFSYRYDAPIDMRMNVRKGQPVSKWLEVLSESELQQILSKFGEVTNAKTLARNLVGARANKSLRSTFELNDVLEKSKVGNKAKYFAQVYQAFRIFVNEEMDVLRDMLYDARDVLEKGGRLVVMSYHSLEDRLVKNVMKTGNVDGVVVKDDFGVIERPFRVVNKKVIQATAEEIERNSRARSAKLRIAEKIIL